MKISDHTVIRLSLICFLLALCILLFTAEKDSQTKVLFGTVSKVNNSHITVSVCKDVEATTYETVYAGQQIRAEVSYLQDYPLLHSITRLQEDRSQSPS